ncbi:hypothetical protein GCM10010358_20710 [Streptomyces minutiscleroticus]|uniref:Uncharacterized protein n=1 Tax=Streptomyces minutiscleroticus TaxID=68238 RepID=A0A918NFA6_9ACTN|nr:hypothetical protein GCM10010358_20710 [Streptomyces minutiscleroticus]
MTDVTAVAPVPSVAAVTARPRAVGPGPLRADRARTGQRQTRHPSHPRTTRGSTRPRPGRSRAHLFLVTRARVLPVQRHVCGTRVADFLVQYGKFLVRHGRTWLTPA